MLLRIMSIAWKIILKLLRRNKKDYFWAFKFEQYEAIFGFTAKGVG